jgi:HD-GYP domain-containing protein (c-di-GMP phosphodiesterase class II)
MTTDRPYKRAMEREQAFAHVKRKAGTHFDPDVVKAFLKVFDTSNDQA